VHHPSRTKKLTPVMQQWVDAKAAHPDAILFFRMGDFYEVFSEDAVVASSALGLTLTSRNKGAPDEVPMAGVPHHAAHGYVAKLLALGHKVALCEQLADPSKTKGIVPRGVVRVLTPGLITDTDQLDARTNHYLVALDGGATPGSAGVGIALFDLSTGELVAGTLSDGAAVLAEVARADPHELLVGESLAELAKAVAIAAPRAALRTDEALEDEQVGAVIDAATEDPIFAEAEEQHGRLALRAAARALRFAQKNTPSARIPVRRVGFFDPSGTLRIDETAQLHLELVRAIDGGRKGSLLDVIDATRTPKGARLLRTRLLAPLVDVAAIRRRHDEVELFVTHSRARSELQAALAEIGDVERLAVRATLHEATPRDLGALRDGLLAAPRAVAAVRTIPDPTAADVLGSDIDTAADLAAHLARALVDRPPPHAREGGIVRDGFDGELDELRQVRRHGAELMTAMELSLREQTQIASLKLKYTSVFGWYIEVTRSHLAKVPDTFRRKQTVAQGERYTTPELDDLADKLEHAEERSLERESALFDALVRETAQHADRVRRLAARLAEWDVASGLAEIAHRFDYARPEVDTGEVLELRGARHPVVERLAAAGRFVPNDTTLDLVGERLWLVTGPNMAGKSTLMRQVALVVILAQMGSYVPAEAARIGLVDRVLSRVGASDNVARGESTFMVEMRETAAILREATRRSLVILDEIGRGTSTYDGLAIAWAVTEHLHDAIGCRALFATHYHELTELSRTLPNLVNYSVSAREHEGDVVFLHKLQRGPASRSYGVAVARLAGLPETVLARARALLASLEAGEVAPAGKRERARAKAPAPQLDLFGAPREDGGRVAELVALLRELDPNRMTPLEALGFVSRLKAMLG
jgi:DNA mismatch repair protein MutS